jgi:membrane protein
MAKVYFYAIRNTFHMHLKDFLELLKATFTAWSEDRVSRLAAALAYYAIFSLAPLLIIVIGVAGLVFNQADVREQIIAQTQDLFGKSGAQLIDSMLSNAFGAGSGWIATGIGIAILVFAATGLVVQLQGALNTIWGVDSIAKEGIINLLKDRLISLAMILGIGFLLLISLILGAVLSTLNDYFANFIPNWVNLLQFANLLLSFVTITVLFAMIYKILPDVQITWRDVWIGAVVTALLFTIGKTLIGLYLSIASVGSAYGVAGSLVVILLWIYYSAQIVLLGAEFTQVYARKYGSQIVPDIEAEDSTDSAEQRLAQSKAEQVR